MILAIPYFAFCENYFIFAPLKRFNIQVIYIMPKVEKAKRSQLMVRFGGKRTQLDIEKDMWWAVAEVAKGRTYRDIAEELNSKNEGYNLSHMQVYRDVQNALIEWKRQNMENIDAYIAKDLARLDHIEEIVMANFEKSKLPRPNEYASLMKRGLTMEEIDAMYEERGGMAGDPRFLETLLHVQMQRMKLLGIDKGNDVPQNSIVNYNFGNANMDELANIADMLQDSKLKELTIDNQENNE